MANFPTIAIGLPFVHGSGIDADAQAFLTAAGITNATITNAIDRLVKNLKGTGDLNNSVDLWTRLTAIYPCVGGTSVTNSYNLRNISQYNLTFSGTITYSATGFKPNGTNGFADTGIAQNLFSNTNNGMSVYFQENTKRDEVQMGYINRTTFRVLSFGMAYSSNNKVLWGNKYDESFTTNTYTNVNGLIRINRTTANQFRLYRNGSVIETSNVASVSDSNTNTIVIGGQRRSDNNGVQAFSNKTFSYADCMINGTYSAAEELTYYNIIQAFQTDLSRNV